MSLIRGVLLAGKFRTLSDLNSVSSDEQRNILIVEMSDRTNQSVAHYQAMDDAILAGAGAVLVFQREARIHDDAEIKTLSDDDLRNSLIIEIAAQTNIPTPTLQGLSNIDLVLLGLGRDKAFIRGVLLAGKFRTLSDLNSVSSDEQRNILIVEMSDRTNQSVAHYQAMDDAILAGAGAVLVFQREARIHDDAEIKTLSDDDLRNSLIIEIAAQTNIPTPTLQGLSNIDLVRTGLGSDPIGDAIATQKIRELYLNSGAHRGLLGFPLSNVQFDSQKAEQRFAGGKIEFLDVTPKGVATTSVRVRFVGFHCDRESDDDQLSGSDEPYFIIGVAGSNRSNTIRFGPYENVDTGTVRFEATMLADPFSQTNPILIVPPILIGVVAIEHDAGTPEEAEEKVRNIIKEIEEKFDQAAATFFGIGTAGNHVLPEWARDILIGWAPEGIAAVFGLGDDQIASVPRIMFDFNPDLEKWTNPPELGVHGENPYNTEILVDGGGEGIYKLRFQVEIVDIDILIRRAA